jgi:hypothetical protein
VAATFTLDKPRGGSAVARVITSIRRGTGNLGVYATGGVAVGPKDVFLKRRLGHLKLSPSSDGSTLFFWDRANGKIKAFTAVGTEVTNSTDITSKVFRFHAEGDEN